MSELKINPIGVVRGDGDDMRIVLNDVYASALAGLEGFGHVQVLWWFSACDSDADRQNLQEQAPYRNAPDVLGVFATRSPMRPNPIALSCAQVLHIDKENATIHVAWLDAADSTPVLDIKPYTPSLDRVENPQLPAWCAGWPASVEASGNFDWASVFRF